MRSIDASHEERFSKIGMSMNHEQHEHRRSAGDPTMMLVMIWHRTRLTEILDRDASMRTGGGVRVLQHTSPTGATTSTSEQLSLAAYQEVEPCTLEMVERM
jgi:hypothetical protein